MCNNIPSNRLNKAKKEEVVKDKISDWLESRPELARKNIKAIEKKEILDDRIEYAVGFPLKLNDGTRIHKIISEKINDEFIQIRVEFNFKKENKKNVTHFKRYYNDSLLEIEEFLSNCQSIIQTRNIDLNYK